jgi:hypothetical protein
MFDQIHRKLRFERAKKMEISDVVIAAWVSRDGLDEAIGFLLLFSSTSVLLEGWGDLRWIGRGKWSIFLEKGTGLNFLRKYFARLSILES